MADGGNNRITIDLGDLRVWLMILASLFGVPLSAVKVALWNVESQQQHVAESASKAAENSTKAAEKAAENSESIDGKLGQIRDVQNQFIGEMRYRLDQVERRVRELPAAMETKKGR
jgi:hypothetical protein